jgi:hypothetical protein
MLKRAGIHDLRRNFASLLVSGGAPPEIIWRLLCFTEIGTIHHYARLVDPPLRTRVKAVGKMLNPRLNMVGERGEAGWSASVDARPVIRSPRSFFLFSVGGE